MARTSWFDAERGRPLIQEQLHRLDGYMRALADGVIEPEELAAQERRLVAALQEVEPLLDDALHEKVTRLLLEVGAWNVMRILHELSAQRAATT
jgi:hypothetical protein